MGTRAMYYDGAGALRDMVQNHMLQVLSLTGMEPPVSLAADAMRDAKVNVIRSLRPIDPADVRKFVVRGQYVAGELDGKHGTGLSAGGRHPRDLAHRNFRRAKGDSRQLAMGGRAVLSAHRQASAVGARALIIVSSRKCPRFCSTATSRSRPTPWRSASSPTRASRSRCWPSGPAWIFLFSQCG